ncbi:MAG TPA: hypothetical protein VMZ22_03280 [Acidimicrobiales bacterium]|nr:hypothetical protein [Acidimicrobiales bacterium]
MANSRERDLELLDDLTSGQRTSTAAIDSGGPPPPDDGAECSAEWCTDALRAGGVIDAAAVLDVSSSSLGPDTPGFFGVLSRLHLTYDEPHAGPVTVIAKRNSPEEFNRAIATAMGFYEREFRSYRELAPLIPMRMAQHYYSALDGDRFVLLLQDLADGRVGHQSTPASVADVEAVLDELALLHGEFLNAPALDEMDWIRPVDANAAV